MGQLLEQGHSPVFEINGHREVPLEGEALQFLGILGREGDRFLQEQMLASRQGLHGQGQPRRRRGGEHQRINGGIGEKRFIGGSTGQIHRRRGGSQPLRARMPEGDGLHTGAGPQGRHVHVDAEAQAHHGNPQGLARRFSHRWHLHHPGMPVVVFPLRGRKPGGRPC